MVKLGQLLVWYWVGCWVPRESVGGVVHCSLNPLRREVVGDDLVSQPLEAWILNFIQAMAIENRHKRVVVRHYREVRESSEEELTLGDGPCYGKELQLDDGVPRFSV